MVDQVLELVEAHYTPRVATDKKELQKLKVQIEQREKESQQYED